MSKSEKIRLVSDIGAKVQVGEIETSDMVGRVGEVGFMILVCNNSQSLVALQIKDETNVWYKFAQYFIFLVKFCDNN